MDARNGASRPWGGALASLLLSVALAACGGGGDGNGGVAPAGPGAASGSATLGAAGGSVVEASGARVEVPASALAVDTTIRIAQDGSGAPALPEGVTAVSPVYALTPHGSNFAVPVKVSLPLPNRTLAEGEQWVLYKASPGGTWSVLGDAVVADGNISAAVSSFSYFAVGIISIRQSTATPFSPTFQFECPNQVNTVCQPGGFGPGTGAVYGAVHVRVAMSSNGGALPAACNPQAARLEYVFRLRTYTPAVGSSPARWIDGAVVTGQAPVASNTTDLRLVPDLRNSPFPGQTSWYGDVRLACDAGNGRPAYSASLWDRNRMGDLQFDYAQGASTSVLNTRVELLRAAPAVRDGFARVEAIASGGYSLSVQGYGDSATDTSLRYIWPQANRPEASAWVDWERSDDDGATWTTIGHADQADAERDPSGGGSAISGWWWRVALTYRANLPGTSEVIKLRAVGCAKGRALAQNVVDRAVGPQATTEVTNCQRSAVITVRPTLAQGDPPRWVQTPRAVLVRTGQTASFNAVAEGTPAPTLQWQTRAANSSGDWTDIAGATGASHSTAVLGPADNGRQFRVTAANAAGNIESPPVTVSVSDADVAPTVTTQPASIAVPAGGDAVFAIAARGTEALSYQWRFNGNAITGANAPVLKLAAVTGAQAGRYSVLVSNGAGSATSSEATLDVTAGTPAAVAPTVVTAPAAVTVNVGNTATFAVGVGGTAPYAYQWLKDGQPIEGATAAFYSLAAATAGNAGSYSVRVTNAAGSVTSAAATLSVVDSPAPVAAAITTQPSPQVQLPGGSATFAVAASGTGPLAYPWLKNGTPIAGATGAVLVLTGVTGGDAASYAVTVTNGLGSVASNGATLTVIGAPAITSQPAARSVTAGATATFSVTATGSGLGYQWTRDGVAIAGATAASYTTPLLDVADSGSSYAVIVYNGAGVAVSTPALLTVSAAPAVSPALARGKIAAAYLHTCAITAANAVACWGHNTSGQIGTGNVAARSTPYVWSLPEAAVSVSAGANGSCAVTVSGNVWCSGSPLNTLVPTQLSGFSGVRQVAVGQMHTCVLASDAAVWCWGANGAGMLGNGGTSPSATPVRVQAADGTALAGVQAIQAGLTHTCATDDNYDVHCWGNNSSAQAGATAGTDALRATLVTGAKYTDHLALGGRFSCAYIGEGGVVSCWGLALDGSNTMSPTASAVFSSSPAAVGAGEAMACAITDGGAVYCWGTGMMGNGNVNENQWSPTAVSGLTGALAMAGGQGHSCVLRTGGSLLCWGSNSDYQLGTGDSVARNTPNAVSIAGGFWQP